MTPRVNQPLSRQERDRNIMAIAYTCQCSVDDVFRAIKAGCVSLQDFKDWVANNKGEQ